ncbi:hypothetical protein [Deinococcus koreensis]|uniref:Uncharacterized protein n=1 Tax=Deinococcus koreensis TaxID=2054903 RepID=A0A2K3UV51_9DEIO|nr:hypothetical protein [Deinococcus koreensis]PNY80407.1 hypothetical protein CVO96_02615 [Deinococcus koreensis]
MRRLLLSSLTLLSLGASTTALAVPTGPPGAPPSAVTGADSEVLAALHLYVASFQPVGGETSLLAYARREALDWTAVQNLWASQFSGGAGRFLEWRGHSQTPGGSVFTTLRAALYGTPGSGLLVVNREWCSAGSCQARTAFAWQDAGGLRAVRDSTVIPLIRDADFYPGDVPECLQGVVLNVSYVPSWQGQTLSATAVLPRASAQRCAATGVSPEAVTRPLRLNWTASVGKFRRGW